MESLVDRLHFLGPVAITHGGSTHLINGRPALVLGALSAVRGSWLSWDAVADEISTAKPPSRAAIHTTISRLRTSMGPVLAKCLQSGPNGYRLVLTSRTCDVIEFHQLCELAGTADEQREHDEVLVLADRAFGLWSGRPFENAAGGPQIDAYRRVIERERLELIDTAAVAALATGQGRQLVAQLEGAVESEPLRETSSVLLAECQAQAGHRVAALRTLQSMRRSLADIGLTPGERVNNIEQHLLTTADPPPDSIEPLPVMANTPFAAATVATAIAHLDASRFRPALREAERFLSQQVKHSNVDTAEAWIVCALASHALMRPIVVRHAVGEAVTAALAEGGRPSLRRALALTPLATAPNEPNQPIVSALEHAQLDGEDAIWAMSAIAANLICGATARSATSATELAAQALKLVDSESSPDLRAFAVECWLRVTEGEPGSKEQERVASRCLASLRSGAGPYAVLTTHRAQRSLRSCNREQFEADMAAVERLAAATGMAEDLAISMQMCAALLSADGERGESSAMIEAAAKVTVDHPVHQEVAHIQRWWLDLDDNPAKLLDNLTAFAGRGRSPAYLAMLMYTMLRVGDRSGATEVLDILLRSSESPLQRDGAYPTALAGLAETAVLVEATDYLSPLRDMLSPFAGEMLVGPGQSFIMGSADRFLGMLSAALGEGEQAIAALRKAEQTERRLGFSRLARATTEAAARVL